MISLNNIYFYGIPTLITTLLLIDIYIRLNQNKRIEEENKEADKREIERAKKFYNKLLEQMNDKNDSFNKILKETLNDKKNTANEIKKITEEQKEIINNNISLQQKYAETIKIIKNLEDDIEKYKGTLRRKVKQIVRLKTKSGIDLNENEKKVFEELKNKGNLNA